jgi:hypothetical protein
MNRAVIKPQARIAAMLGMTIPARKPPSDCNFSRMFILLLNDLNFSLGSGFD